MEELLRKLKSGDEMAFEQVFNMYERQLLTIAEIRTNDCHLAKDLVQETFLSLYVRAKEIKDASKLKSWLTIVLINKCSYYLRREKIIHISYEQNNFENIIYSDEKFKDVEDKVDFLNYIKYLNYDERTLIAMYYDGDYTTKEISEILKINEGTIKSKISRAKIKLKNKMEEE